MDYAAAVNEELRDLAAAGADVVQIDEPYLQARPEPAREYALPAINRALEGIDGTTALHTCFGYAAIVHNTRRRLPVPGRADGGRVDQISVEAAQPRLDPRVLEALPKGDRLGVLDLGDRPSRRPRWSWNGSAPRSARDARRLVLAPDCGMKYLPRAVARGKLAAMVEGARRRRRSRLAHSRRRRRCPRG